MMKQRLNRIVTKTGDQGTTSLATGERLTKNHIRIVTGGEVDELNSVIGIILAYAIPEAIKNTLAFIQQQLFEIGAELTLPETNRIEQREIDFLESAIQEYLANLAPLKEFILPGGGLAASHCHLARTVCRRAERSIVSLQQESYVNPLSLVYLNRLSDLLFIFARCLSDQENTLWQPKQP